MSEHLEYVSEELSTKNQQQEVGDNGRMGSSLHGGVTSPGRHGHGPCRPHVLGKLCLRPEWGRCRVHTGQLL